MNQLRLSSRSLIPKASMLASACQMPSAATAPRVTSTRSYGVSSYGASEAAVPKSAPKSAEKASSQSGGSRSKEAVETGSSPTGGVLPDSLAEGDMRGRTGGGEPLASSRDAPPQPKISNASVPGAQPKLTEAQRAEVEAHNRDFEKKHGRAEEAAPHEDDKVDKSFWSGRGSRYNKE
ncbi:hypothetical protein VTK56DRAFT_5074 [Thermocarpiscus australiensis]